MEIDCKNVNWNGVPSVADIKQVSFNKWTDQMKKSLLKNMSVNWLIYTYTGSHCIYVASLFYGI